MRVKVSELQGTALDWAVANCEGLPIQHDPMGFRTGSEAGFWVWPSGLYTDRARLIGRGYSPSTDWSLAGPIIERERIMVCPGPQWSAVHHARLGRPYYGTAPIIAAMRCYVASKMGDEIQVPDVLVK